MRTIRWRPELDVNLDGGARQSLIDNYFVDDRMGGWSAETAARIRLLTPVVLFTADGGQTWTDQLQNSGIEFPSGEWGWKIQFLKSAARLRLIGEPKRRSDPENDRWRADVEADRGE